MDALALLRAIRNNDPKLTALIVPQGVPPNSLATALSYNTTITQLVLSNCMAYNLVDFCQVLESLSNNPSLRLLDLSDLDLDADFLVHVVDLVLHSVSLVKLDLSRSIITPQVAWELGCALRHHPSMRVLVVASCELGDEGAVSLLEGLTPEGCELNKIDFSHNHLSDAAGASLLSLVRNGAHDLLALNLHGNFIPKEVLEPLHAVVEGNRCRIERECNVDDSGCLRCFQLFKLLAADDPLSGSLSGSRRMSRVTDAMFPALRLLCVQLTADYSPPRHREQGHG